MKKKWGFKSLVGVLASVALVVTPSAAVWAGGAGDLIAQPNLAVRDSTNGLIVKLRDRQTAQAHNLNANQVRSLSNAAGIDLTHFRAMSGDAQVFKLPQHMPMAEVEAIARRLSVDPQVEYAEPDRIMRPLLVPNDTQYVAQWHYKSHLAPDFVAGGANLPGAWDITTGSASIVVAVIDTGLVPHADIDSNILDGTGRVVPGYDFVTNTFVANDGDGRDSDPTDPGDWATQAEVDDPTTPCLRVENSSWHGTHVAGTIGALGNNSAGVAGVNWVSRILPVRALGKCGGNLSDIVDGIRWAAGITAGLPANANPARVLNMSLGSAAPCSAAPSIQSAINDVTAIGAVVVVAAGNDNVDASNAFPASCNGVITVAAINRLGARAPYSNFGATVEIAAPGGDQSAATLNGVLSTLNTGTTTPVASPTGDTFVYYQGTSMAAPHVAGIVSLMLSVNPALTSAQVLALLQTTARVFPTGTGGFDCNTTICGAGIIDATAATAAAAAAAGPTVSVAATDSAAAEAGLNPGTFTITRTGSTASAVTVNYSMSGTATSGNDYTSVGTSVVIPAASTTTTVTLTPIDDALSEGNETAILTLTAATGYTVSSPASATVTIADDEVVSVSATDPNAAEAGLDPGTFTITRTGSTASAVTVNYSMSGTATSGNDYVSVGTSVVIPAASTTTTVTLTPINDALGEGNETAILTLTAGTGYTVSSPASATVTIVDDEQTVTVAATDAAAAEAGLNPGTFTITRGIVTASPLTVNYTMGGTATNGVDYVTVNSNVIIAANSPTAIVTIAPINDAVFEVSETAILTLAAGTGYSVISPSSATVNIADNDLPPPAPPRGPSGGCFIATAAYGTPMADDVRHLRAFRDEYLQTNDAGRWLVSQYYKFSPPLADFLRQHDDLRAVVRTALGPLVSLSKAVVSDATLAAQTAGRP